MSQHRKKSVHPGVPIFLLIGFIAVMGALCAYGPLFPVAEVILTLFIDAVHGVRPPGASQ
jgi:hypothetical protein